MDVFCVCWPEGYPGPRLLWVQREQDPREKLHTVGWWEPVWGLPFPLSWWGPCSIFFSPVDILSAAAGSLRFSRGIVFNSLGTNCTHQVSLCVPSGGESRVAQKDTSSWMRSFCPHLVGFTYYLFLSHLNHLDNLSPFFPSLSTLY